MRVAMQQLRPRHAGAAAAAFHAHQPVQFRCRHRRPSVRCSAHGRSDQPAGEEDARRDQVKRLTALFYHSSTQQEQQRPGAAASARNITSLPLWRVEWPVLPGQQEVLHVMAPHYIHMFEQLFASPRPWRFGSLYLPGGSRSLGRPAYELSPGSKSPLVGVVMQVTRALRLRDGKLLLLATALARFRVVSCKQESPYSIADVSLLEDSELLDSLQPQATAAVLQAAGDQDEGMSALMAASSVVAAEAAAAVSWAWLRGYELAVAQQQEWPGPGPREGDNDAETHSLVQALAEQGVAEVLPLPDGLVVGRYDLASVAAKADAALSRALQASAAQALAQSRASTNGSSSSAGCVDAAAGSGLNTSAQRGVSFEAPELAELTASTAASSSSEEVLLLEAAVWAQLDVLAGLARRVKGRPHAMPFGLLQLRPPPVQPHLAGSCSNGFAQQQQDHQDLQDQQQLQQEDQQPARQSPPVSAKGAAASAAPGSQEPTPGGKRSAGEPGVSSRSRLPPEELLPPGRFAYAASDGCYDLHASPLYPPLRRAAKLSWAVALAAAGRVELESCEARQALLESCSMASRLRVCLALLQKHTRVLAALAAVKDVQQ